MLTKKAEEYPWPKKLRMGFFRGSRTTPDRDALIQYSKVWTEYARRYGAACAEPCSLGLMGHGRSARKACACHGTGGRLVPLATRSDGSRH